jgi:hypothetical protein
MRCHRINRRVLVRSAGFSVEWARFSLDVTGLCCNNSDCARLRFIILIVCCRSTILRHIFYDLRILESLHHASESCFVLQDLGVSSNKLTFISTASYLVYSLGQCIRHRFFDQIYLLKNTRLLSTFQREYSSVIAILFVIRQRRRHYSNRQMQNFFFLLINTPWLRWSHLWQQLLLSLFCLLSVQTLYPEPRVSWMRLLPKQTTDSCYLLTFVLVWWPILLISSLRYAAFHFHRPARWYIHDCSLWGSEM